MPSERADKPMVTVTSRRAGRHSAGHANRLARSARSAEKPAKQNVNNTQRVSCKCGGERRESSAGFWLQLELFQTLYALALPAAMLAPTPLSAHTHTHTESPPPSATAPAQFTVWCLLCGFSGLLECATGCACVCVRLFVYTSAWPAIGGKLCGCYSCCCRAA